MPENVKKTIAECYIIDNVSKNGKPYSVLHIDFENGYTLEHFLTNEQKFIVGQVCPTL